MKKNEKAKPRKLDGWRAAEVKNRERILADMSDLCTERLRDPNLTKEEREEALIALAFAEGEKKELWIIEGMLDPKLSAKEQARLAYLHHPPAENADDMTDDGQVRVRLRRMLGVDENGAALVDEKGAPLEEEKLGNQVPYWRGHEKLIRALAMALLNDDGKLSALIALKSATARDEIGKRWREAVQWLLHKWNWIQPHDDDAAAACRLMQSEFKEPQVWRIRAVDDWGLVIEFLWNLLPAIGDTDAAWRKAGELQQAQADLRQRKKSLETAQKQGVSDAAIRKRISRDKKRGNSPR